MANDGRPDEMHDTWRSQPVSPTPMSREELRRKSQQCERGMRRAVWIGVALSGCSAALCAWFFYLLPHTAARIGFSLTFGGEVLFTWQFLKLRRPVVEQARPTATAYRAHLVRQRDLALNAWWKFLLPFIPGPALVLLGFLVPEWGFVPSLLATSVYLASPIALTVPLARRKVRRLDREIAALDAQMSG